MTDTLTMQVYFELDAVWTDVTSDVISDARLDAVWGMSTNKPLDTLADIGQLSFTLKNNTGKYIPGGSAAVSGWDKGTKVKVVFTFLEDTYVKFYGYVDKIRIDAGTQGERKAHVTCVDWLDHAAKYPLRNPAIEENKRADEALTTIVDSMPIQPLARDFDTGTNTFPLVFNSTTQKTRAYSEFNKLASSEFGYIYMQADGTLRFEASDARPLSTPVTTINELTTPGFLLKEDGGYLLQETGDKLLLQNFTTSDVVIDNEMSGLDVEYGETIYNRLSTTVNPTKVGSIQELLYELDSPIYVGADSSTTFNIQFTEGSSKRLVAALPPLEDAYQHVLLHFDGEKNGRLVYDEAGHLWDGGNCEIVGNVKKIGSGSAYLDGSNSYIYSETASTDYEFGSGDFTIEWWEYRFAATAGAAAVSRTGGAGFVPFILGQSDGTNALIYMTSTGASWDIANGKTFGAIATNTWVHYAVTRNGSTFRAFKNGTQTDTWTSSAAILASTAAMTIGKNNATYLNACIDEYRSTKGLSRYNATFTAPTTAFELSGITHQAWTVSNATGTELTPDFTLTYTYGAAGAEVVVTNGSASSGYLTTLKIYSYIVESVNPITDIQEDAVSVAAYGYNDLSINQTYQQDLVTSIAESAKILEKYKNPALLLNKINMYANRNNTMMLYFLQADIGDVVQVVEDVTEIANDYYIQGVEYTVSAGEAGVIVNFSWVLKEHRTSSANLAIDFAGYNSFEYMSFGIIPAITADTITKKIYSAWVYCDSLAQYGYICSTEGPLTVPGSSLGIDSSGYVYYDTKTSGTRAV